MIAEVLAVIVILSSAAQLGYVFFFFGRIGKKADILRLESIQPGDHPLKISVLICAKNEAANLQENLPFILAANYPDAAGAPCYEVIVVNDQSEDESASVLAGFQKEYPHLRVITIALDEPRSLPGKKFALSKGIAAAAHDYLLMTDADCKPAHKHWMAHMAAQFGEGKEIVAGYGGFYEAKGLLNRFIRAETLHTFLQYETYQKAGYSYMAVGRNLACRKALLQRAQAHPLWVATASGDDDLLIQLCATADNMAVCSHPHSFTYSAAKATWSEWMKQKQRHFSTGKLYNPTVQRLLGGYAMSHALGWLSMIALLFWVNNHLLTQIALVLFAIRSLLLWFRLAQTAQLTGERKLFFFWPIFDAGWLCYNIIFAPFIFWKNKQQWK